MIPLVIPFSLKSRNYASIKKVCISRLVPKNTANENSGQGYEVFENLANSHGKKIMERI